jgi:hypothetical protein
MPDHLREQIMDAVVTVVTGLATTGANVHRARVFPQEGTFLPALLIYAGDDEQVAEPETDKHTVIDSVLAVIIEGWVEMGSAQLEETLNAINAEVVVALQADRTQGVAGVIDTFDFDVDEPALMEGSKRIAMLSTIFGVRYRRLRTQANLSA